MARRIKIKQIQRALERYKRQAPLRIAAMATNHFKDSFRMQRFNDDGASPWQARKATDKRARRFGSRNILVKSGRLRNATRKELATFKIIRIVNKTRYASIHNQGLRGKAYGKYDFTMPKRQFMGKSRKLDRRISKKIRSEFGKALDQ